MVRVRSWWILIRATNALLSGAAAWVGAFLATSQWWFPEIWYAILPPILIAASGNIDNDLCDIATDRVIKPDRPLASGAIEAGSARIVLYMLWTVGAILAWFGGMAAFAVAVIVILSLTIYNRFLSGRPIAGNVVIAALGALPIAFGGLVAIRHIPSASFDAPLIAAVIAFWLHLPREILKDALDIDGDRVAGRLTLPMIIGPLRAARWAAIVMVVATAYIAWSAFCGYFGVLYSFGVLITILPALLLGAAQCGFNPSGSVILAWTAGLKLCMAGGLVWLVLGRLKP